jgi:hypothetical protein
VEVRGSGPRAKKDSLVLLPQHSAVLESTGEAGEYDESGFSPYDPPIIVPREALENLCAKPDALSRMLEAVRVEREHVAPFLMDEGDFDLSDFDGALDKQVGQVRAMTEGEMKEGMRSFLKKALGREVDPDSCMREVRIAGGVHGPTHPSWWDLLENLGWAPSDYVDEPHRLEPAFVLPASRHGVQLPAICESYGYFPDDKDDELAEEAMKDVARRFPSGALLLFKDMPYREVDGHQYSFGGMLYWRKTWTPFAMCAAMKSLDDLLDQVEGGFRIGMADARFADDCYVAVPFNRMCHGLDPNERTPMTGLGMGKWITLLPG